MHTLHFDVLIDAPRRVVWDTMLGEETYREWAEEFAAGSHFNGSWDEGASIRFLNPEGNGMLSEIAENRPYEYVSIRHVGFIENGVADTDSEWVRAWTPAYENYTFSDAGVSSTQVGVDLDVTADFEEDMRESWPRALARLKAMTEARAA